MPVMTDADTIRLLGILALTAVPGIMAFFLGRFCLHRGYDIGYRDGLRQGRNDAAAGRESDPWPPE
jgi:hypothetical protein